MNFIQIINKLLNYAKSLHYVKSTNTGDVIDFVNGKPDIKYACVNIDITQSARNDNMLAYTVYLYYIDRLKQDRSNSKEIKTTAEQALESIINYAADAIGDVDDGYVIQFFEERFADYLAGGQVSFILSVPNEMGQCMIDDFEEDEPTLLITSNGTFDVGEYKKVIVNVPSVTTEEITQEEYDALTEYDPNKIYLIQE